MTGMLEKWSQLSAAWRNIIVFFATAGGIIATLFFAAQGAFEEKYATRAYVEERVEPVERQAQATQREVTRVQINQSASEIRQINNSVFQLQKAVDGNLLQLSPVERSHYDYLQDQLRKAVRDRDEAEARFRSLADR